MLTPIKGLRHVTSMAGNAAVNNHFSLKQEDKANEKIQIVHDPGGRAAGLFSCGPGRRRGRQLEHLGLDQRGHDLVFGRRQQ